VKDWINEIIRELGLRLECADIEIRDPGRKRADVIVWERRALKPALLIEIWDARTPPWEAALDLALSKAWKNDIPYFAVWNLTHFYCWDTFAEGGDIDKLWWPHAGVLETVCDAISYDDAILRYKDVIRNYLKVFLREFVEVYYGIKAKPPLGIDERFIYRLRGTIHALSIPIFDEVSRKAKEDPEFKRNLIKYFREQAWTFKEQDEDFEKVARQYVYLLTNKILFYNILRSIPKYKRVLGKITIPEVGLTGKELRDKLDLYFRKGFEVTGNYETVLLSNFLDSITPPDNVVGSLKDFIHRIGGYDFSRVNYEVLGNIFQRLIPEEERHKLGQYFTRSDVVDLIVGFCVRNADDKVLDGGCGAGTFLVRSYVRKKSLNPAKDHKDILNELYGVDVAKFPAHLSTINLASRNLLEVENYPRILHMDFFDVSPGREYLLFLRERVETLGVREVKIRIPSYFDAAVMNPPYTRQEEMEDILEEEKDKAFDVCVKNWKDMSDPKYTRRKPKLSKRASIYVHFFIHAGKFLKNRGRLGLITSNSWLDVDYGYDLQRFFLENFKIVAVIESKVERWFEDADINTAITILERCKNPEEREKNLVKFVQLKKPLAEFIPPTQNETERWKHVENLIRLIGGENKYFEDENIRVYPKRQRELWEEGYDREKNKYVGSKWGKYIRAPEIFFKILDKGNLVSLKDVAKVNPGIKSGADKFFYLKEEKIKKYGIENEYVKNLIIKSIRECKKISVKETDLKYRVLMVSETKQKLHGTNVLKYIEYGETLGLSNPKTNPTCGRRPRWYDLGEREISYILWPDVIFDRYLSPYNEANALADYDLHEIKPFKNADDKIICALLNSSLTPLFAELNGRVNLGQGSLKMQSHEIATIFIIDPRNVTGEIREKIEGIFDAMKERKVESVFKELGAENPETVRLDTVKPDRRELDKIVMGEILGLTEEEQLKVYRAIIDLVKSRIEKAKSVRKKKKVGELDVDALVNSVMEDVMKLHGIEPKAFPEDYIGEAECSEIEVPKGSKAEARFDLEGPFIQIDGEKIRCNSMHEAKYIEYAVLAGKNRIRIPKDEGILRRAVQQRGKLLRDAKTKVEDFLQETIADKKLREKVRFEVCKRLGF